MKIPEILEDKYRKIDKSYKKNGGQLKPFQEEFLSALSSGKDLLYTEETTKNLGQLQNIYTLHAITLLLAKRKEILKHSEKIAKATADGKEPPVCKDQGFSRPSILIVLPMRHSAYLVIESILTLCLRDKIENKTRFLEDFAPTPEELDDDDSKPEDYNITFRGKTDDCFRIGIKLTKKSLRLYSAFYESDIIIASPLGLRTIIGVDGDAKRDFDFLSSISLCVMDQTDIIAMQNWEHVTTLFQHLNLIPTKPRDCDFSRIKEEYLDGKGSTIRQTVFLSKYPFPELNALTSTYFSNAKGSSIIALPLVDIKVTKLSKNIKLGCHKLNPNSLEASADYRFYWFSKNMDSILEQGHCIYVASYFDFVRLKNLFTANELSFAAISEYSTGPEISAARASFFNRHVKILLVTERYHFFKRHTIRGAGHLFFYSLPSDPSFFNDYVSYVLKDSPDVEHCTISFAVDRFDNLKTVSIFGLNRAAKCLSSSKPFLHINLN